MNDGTDGTMKSHEVGDRSKEPKQVRTTELTKRWK